MSSFAQNNQFDSDSETLTTQLQQNLQNVMGSQLFSDDQQGGRKRKSKKGSKRASNKGSKRASKSSQEGGKRKGSKKASKKASKKGSKRASKSMQEGGKRKGSKKASKKGSKRAVTDVDQQGGRKRKGKKSSRSVSHKLSQSVQSQSDSQADSQSQVQNQSQQDGGKKKKGSKRASSKSKRVLPEKLVEFQKTVKHVAAALGHSKHAFKLAKMLRDEAMKGNANASPQDVTKKANKLFDDNKSKWSAEHAKMKAGK